MDSVKFFEYFAIYWTFLGLLPLLPSQAAKKAGGWALFITFFASLIAGYAVLHPWQRLWLTTVGLIFTLKSAYLCHLPQSKLQACSRLGYALYMTIWPGFDFDRLARRQSGTGTNEDGKSFVPGYMSFWLGAALFAFLSFSNTANAWLSLLSILLMLHLGYAVMLSSLMRLAGFNIRPLFNRPEVSTSLNDFWSRRWNIAFVEMNRRIFLPWLSRRLTHTLAVVAVFLVSGILHELAISYPAAGGYGLPLLYFLIQAFGVSLEKNPTLKNALKNKPVARVWTYAWLLLPLPLLCTAPFQQTFIAPLALAGCDFARQLTQPMLLGLALWLAGAGHFCTLFAGLQVPFRLHWKEELARLSTFNRKIMLNYAGYTGMMIVAFGVLTFKLHNELLTGNPVAVDLAVLIAIFWIVRILVDIFCFGHEDWPKGPQFVIGHSLLTTLFIAMASVYSYVVWINL